MDKPLCKLCTHKHYSYEPHIFTAAQQPSTDNVTIAVTNSKPACNHCVTKDAEIERLRNQLADALKRADEWAKISIEVGKNERKKAKRDRAAYMREYRATQKVN